MTIAFKNGNFSYKSEPEASRGRRNCRSVRVKIIFSYPIWNHDASSPGLSLLGDGPGNYYHIPKLVSQIIHAENRNCFHFNYKTNGTVTVIQE